MQIWWSSGIQVFRDPQADLDREQKVTSLMFKNLMGSDQNCGYKE